MVGRIIASLNTIRRGRGQVRPCDRVRPEDATIVTRLDCAILRAAAAIAPTNLRSLDAIHLATAMSLGQDLAGIVTYD
jgi:predicted nucleic acid-binding protein